MHITGIICEYNPLHLGHRKQMDTIRRLYGQESAIVCLMSGNFVQRGHPAIFDKMTRARAALCSGADLVLELPVTCALSSAEGFAAGGVRLLSPICDSLCFGAETPHGLMQAAQTLLSPEFSELLKDKLALGLSFPAARQETLVQLGIGPTLVSAPNNILALEYCKAILAQKSRMEPLPICREGGYHDVEVDPENPSATALRQRIQNGQDISPYIPTPQTGVIHSLHHGERAMLARLRTMTAADFETLPYGSEGLWMKLMHNCRKHSALEDILTATKSKRYTRSRLDRMVMCAFLGLTAADLAAPAPCARVLALNGKGRTILRQARQRQWLPNIGEKLEHPFQAIEDRCDSLYGLFAETPEAPEPKYRVYAAPSP